MDDQFVTATHRGQHRETNEDTVLARHLPEGWVLLAVADGVGGAQAGEVASRDAVRLLVDHLLTTTKLPPERRLTEAVDAANLGVWRRQQSEARLHGMATTLVAALVRNGQAWVANVGDSRGFVTRGPDLLQVTEDHSLVAEQLRAGEITPEEAWVSNVRNIITRTIGTEEEVAVDVFGPVELHPGARLFLSSDGVHDVIEHADLAAAACAGSITEAAQRIIDAANERGGPDNISVAIYEQPRDPHHEEDADVITEPLSRYAISGITA